jgi:hypothetical protein
MLEVCRNMQLQYNILQNYFIDDKMNINPTDVLI